MGEGKERETARAAMGSAGKGGWRFRRRGERRGSIQAWSHQIEGDVDEVVR